MLPIYLAPGIGVDTEVTKILYSLALACILHIFLSFFSLSLLSGLFNLFRLKASAELLTAPNIYCKRNILSFPISESWWMDSSIQCGLVPIPEPIMWLGEQDNIVQNEQSIINYDFQKIRRLGKQNNVCLTKESKCF